MSLGSMAARARDAGRSAWGGLPAPIRDRLPSAVVAVGTGIVLAIALVLTPDPQGHGTHLQLGLNQCSFLTATGFPCPMCGATTTFTLWAHAQPLAGIANQPFASLLFVMTAGAFAVSTVEAIAPKRRWQRLYRVLAPWELTLALSFLGVMCASWIWKIWLMAGQSPT